MPRLRITDLGQHGLNSDIPPPQLPINAWTDGRNVRSKDGAVRSARGETQVCALPCKPTYKSSFVGFEGQTRILVSDGIRVFAVNPADSSSVDITPGGGTWTGGRVSFCNLNSVMVVNSQTDGAFYWPGLTDDLLALPGWDAGWRCKEMVPYKYFLVALGMEEDGDQYFQKLRWSNSAAEGSVPTEWIASASNDAGDDILGESAGEITGGVLVRDDLWVVKEDSIYAMRWIGGTFVMQTERLTGSIGSSIPGGYAEMQGNLVVLTTADLMLFNGISVNSIVNSRVKDLLQGYSSEYWDRSQIYAHVPSTTLFVCQVESGYDRLSRALTFDWSQNTWGVRTMEHGYGLDEAVVSVSGETATWDTIGDAGSVGWDVESWDELTGITWNRGVYMSSVPDVLLFQSNQADSGWWVSVIDDSGSNWDGSAKYCVVERIGIPIEETAKLAQINELWPEIQGDSEVNISIGSQMDPNGAVTWGSPHTVTPGSQSFLPVRLTGRHLAWKIESNSVGSWALGSITVQWEPAGER